MSPFCSRSLSLLTLCLLAPLLAACSPKGSAAESSAGAAESSSTEAPSSETSSVASSTVALSEGRLALVRDGVATGAVILAKNAQPLQRKAAQTFIDTVARSTGATLPLLEQGQEAQLDPQAVRLYVGFAPESLAGTVGEAAAAPLEPETFRFHTDGNAVYLFAADTPSAGKRSSEAVSRPTLWGLNYLLEHALGVRWLWPGELGTHIPAQRDMITDSLNFEQQPKLQMRRLRVGSNPRQGEHLSSDRQVNKQMVGETREWLENHRAGQRTVFHLGHAFSGWWARYGKEHPDYFAQVPEGQPFPYPFGTRAKLRLANPAVIEQIAQEYIAAGAPKYWNVCPNDSSGFDISPETLAWDLPQGQKITDIFFGRVSLTPRYVEFWNRLYERLVQINPDVVICTYAYASYRNPPPAERPLKAKALIGIVCSFFDYDLWRGWGDTGSSILLRPNWWHHGGDAPYLPLNSTADFIRFAFDNGMLALDMDALLGYWATQGMNYYLVARIMDNPALSTETVIDEYTSAFGKGAPKIKEYIAYWENLSNAYDYQQHEGRGEYARLVKEGKTNHSILNGSKHVLPHLYGEDVIVPAERLLAQAAELAGAEDTLTQRRIAFLQKGLDSLRLSRDQVALGASLKSKPTAEAIAEFAAQAEKMEAKRKELGTDHAIWDELMRKHENHYRVLIRPENIEHHNINLEGML